MIKEINTKLENIKQEYATSKMKRLINNIISYQANHTQPRCEYVETAKSSEYENLLKKQIFVNLLD